MPRGGPKPGAGRPKTLLSVPCDVHGLAPCPSPKGCTNRRERAGLAVDRPLGKREAMRLARAMVAAWGRASLDVGAPILDGAGEPLDPDGRDYEMVRAAMEMVLDGLTKP